MITTKPYARADSDELINRYIEWLDDHNSGLYMIEMESTDFEIIIAFEMEVDMVQFLLSVR